MAWLPFLNEILFVISAKFFFNFTSEATSDIVITITHWSQKKRKIKKKIM